VRPIWQTTNTRIERVTLESRQGSLWLFRLVGTPLGEAFIAATTEEGRGLATSEPVSSFSLSAQPEEREEIRLSVGSMKATIDRKDHPIDENGVLAREKCDYARDFIRGGGPADR
jgi:hypothetical protein